MRLAVETVVATAFFLGFAGGLCVATVLVLLVMLFT